MELFNKWINGDEDYEDDDNDNEYKYCLNVRQTRTETHRKTVESSLFVYKLIRLEYLDRRFSNNKPIHNLSVLAPNLHLCQFWDRGNDAIMKEERREVWFGCGIEGLTRGLSLGCLRDVTVICLRNLHWKDSLHSTADFKSIGSVSFLYSWWRCLGSRADIKKNFDQRYSAYYVHDRKDYAGFGLQWFKDNKLASLSPLLWVKATERCQIKSPQLLNVASMD